MSDKPILFSAPMVLALAAGRKTQTRRTLDAWCHEPPAYVENGAIVAHDENEKFYRWPRTHAVGDRLWVREGFRGPYPYEAHGYKIADWGNKPIWYVADGSVSPELDKKFWPKARPSIHMPRWASRLTLIVEAVKVERLQDISEEDAIAEGIFQAPGPLTYFQSESDGPCYPTAVRAYTALWDSLNAKRGFPWTANPWVVAYTFRAIKSNIDRIGSDQ